MNLSQILNPPSATTAPIPSANPIPRRHRRTSSPPPSLTSATTILRFDTPASPHVHITGSTGPTGTTASDTVSRKHANSISIAQLEEQTSSFPSTSGQHNKTNHHGHGGAQQKIRPNEISNRYSTHTFRASIPPSLKDKPLSSTSSSDISVTSPAPVHSTITASSPTTVTTTATAMATTASNNTNAALLEGSLSELVMSHNTPQDMSSSGSFSKKKARYQGSSTVESSSFQDSFQANHSEIQNIKSEIGTKKKSTKKGGRTSPHTETDPQPIRFVMSDKEIQDNKRQKAGSTHNVNVPSPSQDSQGEDVADQESSQASPTPDFERNADGKY
ncbi:hypothetical protein BX616_007944, partial [Lobosporangium transversale]